MDEHELMRQIRLYAQRIADERMALEKHVRRDARIGVQVAKIIFAAGGLLPVDQNNRNILGEVYKQLLWQRDGHRKLP